MGTVVDAAYFDFFGQGAGFTASLDIGGGSFSEIGGREGVVDRWIIRVARIWGERVDPSIVVGFLEASRIATSDQFFALFPLELAGCDTDALKEVGLFGFYLGPALGSYFTGLIGAIGSTAIGVTIGPCAANCRLVGRYVRVIARCERERERARRDRPHRDRD